MEVKGVKDANKKMLTTLMGARAKQLIVLSCISHRICKNMENLKERKETHSVEIENRHTIPEVGQIFETPTRNLTILEYCLKLINASQSKISLRS